MSNNTSAQRATLRRALTDLTRAGGLDVALRELAFDLLAEQSATQSGAPADPFFPHNLAVLCSQLAEVAEHRDLAGPTLSAAAPALESALAEDPGDLALALALAHHAAQDEAAADLLAAVTAAACRAHAGDRLTQAAARALAARADGAQHLPAIDALLTRLDDLLGRQPEREPAALARIELVALGLTREDKQSRDDAWTRLVALFGDAEQAFGPDSVRDRLQLSAYVTRLRDRQARLPDHVLGDAVELAGRLAQEPNPPVDALVGLESGLLARKRLRGPLGRKMAEALGFAADHSADRTLSQSLAEALDAIGDEEALVEHHSALVRSGRGDNTTREALARVWVKALGRGAPSGLDAEIEAWLVESFPHSSASRLLPETALALVEHVASSLGAEPAGHLADTVLLRQHKLMRHATLAVRTVQLLADAGAIERALDVGHARLNGADSPALRLTLAKIHIGAGIRIAEADGLLRPLASIGGAVAAEARALRDQVVGHPDFEAERVRAMIETETRLGVGSDRPVRCRVIFASDRYVLAEMPGAKAPVFYGHRHLRLMVTTNALPQTLKIDDLPKGTEFTVEVVGENDDRGDRIRVYWTRENANVVVLAKPPAAKKEKSRKAAEHEGQTKGKGAQKDREEPRAKREELPPPTPEQEVAYNIGTGAPARARIKKIFKRGTLLIGDILPPDGDGKPFPITVGVHKRFIPESHANQKHWKGVVIECQIERNETTGKLRYDAVTEIRILSAPEATPDEAAPSSPDGDVPRRRNRAPSDETAPATPESTPEAAEVPAPAVAEPTAQLSAATPDEPPKRAPEPAPEAVPEEDSAPQSAPEEDNAPDSAPDEDSAPKGPPEADVTDELPSDDEAGDITP